MSELTENPPGDSEASELPIEKRLMVLAERLGFRETPELAQIRDKLRPDQLIDESTAIINDYQKLGIRVVEETADPNDPKPQIGLIVATASIKYANGYHDPYRDDMNDANFYASGIGEHEIARELRRILFKGINFRKYKT